MKVVRSTLAMLVTAFVVIAGCEKASEPLAPEGSVAPQSGLLSDLLGGKRGGGSTAGSYTLVEGQLRTTSQSVSAWIGPLGGTLILPGKSNDILPAFHAIVVPPLAVLEPTLFTMSIASDKYIMVDLRAQQRTLLGLKDVGGKGFNLPIVLWLSYAEATNLVNVDLNKLLILHMPEDGRPPEPVKSLVQVGVHKYVVGTLFHFSKYAMAVD